MKVGEEIDALEVMGLNPIKFLVVPKFLAMISAVPCVTVIAMFIMIFGGFAAGVIIVGVDPATYIEMTVNSLAEKDLVIGLTKSFFFGVTICWVGDLSRFPGRGRSRGGGPEDHLVGGDLDLPHHHRGPRVHRTLLFHLMMAERSRPDHRSRGPGRPIRRPDGARRRELRGSARRGLRHPRRFRIGQDDPHPQPGGFDAPLFGLYPCQGRGLHRHVRRRPHRAAEEDRNVFSRLRAFQLDDGRRQRRVAADANTPASSLRPSTS